MKQDLGKFDLNLLVAFDTLMTERGVTRAGRVLGITQAAMSNTLRRLRDIFDDPLFVKSGMNMEPTARALELAGPVSEALKQVRLALDLERFDPAQSSNVFRIGMVDYAAAWLLPALLPILQEKAPGVVLDWVDIGGENEHLALESGTVDLVMSRFQWVPPKVLLYRMFTMQYVFMYRKGHPLYEDGVNLDTFLQGRHVHYYPRGMDSTVVDEALAAMEKKRHIVAQLPTLSMVPFIVADSDMVAILPNGTAQVVAEPLNLEIAPIPFDTPKLRMAIAWHPRTENSPPNIWLREQIRAAVEQT